MTMLIPTINRLDFVDLAHVEQVEGREPLQGMWHSWIAQWTQRKTVLDVGSGLSTIKADLLAAGALEVKTQDPCAWCPCDYSCPVEQIEARYHVVTSLDVIEHVVSYGQFAHHLARIAWERVIITTPGVLVHLNVHPYHYHEFRCDEVVQLFEAAGMILEHLCLYEAQRRIDASGLEARAIAAQEPRVHPMGFVFVKPAQPSSA